MIPQLQGSEEWLSWRKNKIGASDCAPILGLSPWKNSYQLWEEKVGLKEGSLINYHMQRGIALEPVAREYFNKKMGLDLKPKVFTHPKHDWMVASLDGISEDGSIAVEIKCNGEKAHLEATEGKIPEYYYCQLQHQMEVLGLKEIYYLSYVKEEEKSISLVVERDDEIIKTILEKEKEFYDLVVNFAPPPQPYLEKKDKEWVNHVQEWFQINAQISLLQEAEKIKRDILISMSEGKNCIGGGIKLLKEVRKGSIDYKSVPEIAKMDLEPYRKPPTEYWKIIREKKND